MLLKLFHNLKNYNNSQTILLDELTAVKCSNLNETEFNFIFKQLSSREKMVQSDIQNDPT